MNDDLGGLCCVASLWFPVGWGGFRVEMVDGCDVVSKGAREAVHTAPPSQGRERSELEVQYNFAWGMSR